MKKLSHALHLLSLSLSLFLAYPQSTAIAGEKIRYAHFHTDGNERDNYTLELLRLALQKAGGGKELVAVEVNFPQGRGLYELESGKFIDIDWSITSKEREARLLPIRISIDKGLFGWRIPVVKKSNEKLFANVKKIEDFKELTAGQGFNWPDTTILRQAGLKVIDGRDPEGLIKMLSADRFNYYPRSIIDLKYEMADYKRYNFIIDSHIAIHYPSAFYFFVNKKNGQLASHIQMGLDIALKDGSFDNLFNKYYGGAIAQARLQQRKIIEIPNPLLPENTPLSRKELWFHLDKSN